jgi:hypothetical protein
VVRQLSTTNFRPSTVGSENILRIDASDNRQFGKPGKNSEFSGNNLMPTCDLYSPNHTKIADFLA